MTQPHWASGALQPATVTGMPLHAAVQGAFGGPGVNQNIQHYMNQHYMNQYYMNQGYMNYSYPNQFPMGGTDCWQAVSQLSAAAEPWEPPQPRPALPRPPQLPQPPQPPQPPPSEGQLQLLQEVTQEVQLAVPQGAGLEQEEELDTDAQHPCSPGPSGVIVGHDGCITLARRTLEGGPAPFAARASSSPAAAPSLSPAGPADDAPLPSGGDSSPETGMIYIQRAPLSSALRRSAAEGTGHAQQSSRAAPRPMSASPRARCHNGRRTAPADVDAAAAGLVRVVADASAQTEQPPQAQLGEELAHRILHRLDLLDARLTAMEGNILHRIALGAPDQAQGAVWQQVSDEFDALGGGPQAVQH
eukprot:TRINITY_DN4598_c0_g1_i1.p1 TRINITY_DN4598_c0_g1~~TRINITY_DN4598_c0_g1_i1.p1  ORF type:complete len:359 (+),score=73.49 TRINITY_DN4598_c0_g1_i1:105-1181(+)